MSLAKPKLMSLVRKAARLRAAGYAWKTVGEKVGRTADTCANWPLRYPEVWAKAYAKAEAGLLKDAGSEARVVLQKLMRSEDERLQCNAAKMLLQTRMSDRRKTKAAKPGQSTQGITGVQSVDEVLKMVLDLASSVGPVSNRPGF